MGYSDQELRAAVDAVFDQFDTDHSMALDRNEVVNLINAALNQMGAGRKASNEEVNALINAVDKNNDGKIAKPELFEIFKRVANQWFVHSFIKPTIHKKSFKKNQKIHKSMM